jgi:pimeloyl-ACP methyl ester carboxylesterase
MHVLAANHARGSASEPAGYAPFPLVTDPARFGLETRTVVTPLGAVVVRSSRGRESGARGGTATVLLHGAAGSWTTWTPLLSAAVARGELLENLVLVDLPGWGDSPLPVRAGPAGRRRAREGASTGCPSLTVDAYARTVAEVLRRLGYWEWRVVGHSLGGFIALHLAAIESQATLSVGLVSPTTFSIADAAAHPWQRSTGLPAYVALLTVMRAFAPLGGAASVLLRGLRRVGLIRPLLAPLFARPAAVPPSVIGALADDVRPRAFAVASSEAGRYDLLGSWSRIRCPVHSVRGEHDVFVTADDDRMLAAAIPDAVTSVLPGVGHFGQIESPLAVLDLLADSLSARVESTRAVSAHAEHGPADAR